MDIRTTIPSSLVEPNASRRYDQQNEVAFRREVQNVIDKLVRAASQTTSAFAAHALTHAVGGGDVVALAASQITSGTFVDARISESSVTQHEAALTILQAQITDFDHPLVGVDHTASGLAVGQVPRASAATTFAWAQLQHGDLGGVTSDQHHAQVHVLDGVNHTVSGLTIGHFLKATGATTFGFAAHGLTYSDVGAAAASHTHGRTDLPSEIAYEDEANTFSALNIFGTGVAASPVFRLAPQGAPAVFDIGDLWYETTAPAGPRTYTSTGGVSRFLLHTIDVDLASGKVYKINSTQVVGAQGAAVADASGGSVIDAEARTALNALLARVRTHGLIAA
jgi:hypothetical protein